MTLTKRCLTLFCLKLEKIVPSYFSLSISLYEIALNQDKLKAFTIILELIAYSPK